MFELAKYRSSKKGCVWRDCNQCHVWTDLDLDSPWIIQV
jgi:hypothetical protein